MAERLAMAVTSLAALLSGLSAFIDNSALPDECYRGKVTPERDPVAVFSTDDDLQGAVEAWVEKGKYGKLLDFWVKGMAFDWNRLYGDKKPRRIGLPTYPFARKTYWIPPLGRMAPGSDGADRAQLHPLLHENISGLKGLGYRSEFSVEHFFLRDHRINGAPVLPGAAYLEMARAAVEQAINREEPDVQTQAITLSDVLWLQPAVVEGDSIRLYTDLRGPSQNAPLEISNAEIDYEIYQRKNGQKILYSRGRAAIVAQREPPRIALGPLREICNWQPLTKAEIYAKFSALGIDYGSAHQCLDSLSVGADRENKPQVLAKLVMPQDSVAEGRGYVLHPSLLDGALQASIGLSLAESEKGMGPALAYALESIDIFSVCPEECFAWVRYSEGCDVGALLQKLDIDLCDAQGRVCVRMKGFTSRPAAGTGQSQPEKSLRLPQQTSVWEALQPILASGLAKKIPLPPAGLAAQEAAKVQHLLAKMLVSQLQALGLKQSAEPHSVVVPFFRPWLEASFAFLAQEDYSPDAGEAVTLEAAWSEWRRLQTAQPDLCAGFALAEATLRELPAILGGKKPATDILFPGSSLDAVKGVYAGNPQADYFNRVLAEAVAAIIEARLQRDADYTFNLLEVGAGTGATSAAVFDCLRPYRHCINSYCYTDISKAFLLHAEAAYAEVAPYLKTHNFNVEAHPVGQGIEAGSFDIAIASNVLHATQTIHTTLHNVKAALKHNGFLLLNEMTDNSLFVHLTFGLLEGWWRYEDAHLRIPGCPALSLSTWESVLKETGFGPVVFPVAQSHERGQQIIVAQSDGVIRPGLADEQRTKPEWPAARKKPAGTQHNAITQNNSGDAFNDPLIAAQVQEVIIEQLSASLKIPYEEIDSQQPFRDYGVDSITGVQLVDSINRALGIDLETTCLFSYTAADKLANHIVSTYRETVSAAAQKTEPVAAETDCALQFAPVFRAESAAVPFEAGTAGLTQPVAFIGMSGRFAQSDTLSELWEHLARGEDLVEEVTRWDLARLDAGFADPEKRYCRHGGFLSDIDRFDAFFFNISVVEACYMDPQQRLFLEEAWKALEDAGYAGLAIEGRRCGVYVGVCEGYYHQLIPSRAPPQAFWGNSSSILAARIAYFLDLKGPAIAIDTACSSSLVAIHMAAQSLQAGEIPIALAGGIMLHPTPGFWLTAGAAGMLSATGRCHTFDAQADGFVPGEGVGVVILKRLSEALADGDHLYGVIRGSGINQDGASNGIMAPNAKAQELLERQVYETFAIDPAGIQMVEAHGTGTALGDPIEYQALINAFGKDSGKTAWCALGSIKTNLGHTATAAGIAGVIKILLALQQRKIPASLHFQSGNPAIDFSDSPFYVNTRLKDWAVEAGQKRCAAVSSFGFSGTNAHMVIEEAPVEQRQHSQQPGYLIVLSAREPAQLQQQARALADFCEAHAELDIGNISFTLLLGRKAFSHRLATVVRHCDELVERLRKWCGRGKSSQVYTARVLERDRREQASLKLFGNQCIEQCRQGWPDGEYLELLASIAELYIQGYRLDYESLFAESERGKGYSRLSLPAYPFARERYWVPEAESLQAADTVATDKRRQPPAQYGLLLCPHWQKAATENNNRRAQSDYARHWILLVGNFQDAHLELLKQEFSQAQSQLLTCELQGFGERYEACAIQVFDVLKLILEQRPTAAILVQVVIGRDSAGGDCDTGPAQCFAGLSALLKTAVKENPRLVAQCLHFDLSQPPEVLVEQLNENTFDTAATEIRYRQGVREIKILREMAAGENIFHNNLKHPWKDAGVYLITGGLGGLGLIFAETIAVAVGKVTLLLTGRSPANREKQLKLDALAALGATVEYQSLDVSDSEAVENFIAQTVKQHGTLNAVLHCAGVIEDNFIIRKTRAEFQRVLAPKVAGLVNLDEATAALPLDFLLLFSSASVMGNPGQADYAAANGFMDAYAGYRNALVEQGRRCGKTVAIDWPLWAQGGMQVDSDARQQMAENGLLPLQKETGLGACCRILALREPVSQVMVLAGERQKLSAFLSRPHAVPESSGDRTEETTGTVDSGKVLQQLQQVFAGITRIAAERIDREEPLESFGIDSLMIVQLNRALEKVFGDIPKTLFYEYRTLGELSAYLAATYPRACRQWTGSEEVAAGTNEKRNSTFFESCSPTAVPIQRDSGEGAIAIIGLSGRYPGAENPAMFWENLLAGKNCITEIPVDRWPLRGFYHSDREQAMVQRKSYSKWGGFIDGFADFDPLFFNMTPREAENVDPQERLFLLACWTALEDAGCPASHLSDELRRRTAVFGGITKQGFNLYSAQTPRHFPSTSFASLANRVSYCLNLQGPSAVVDTMCSSALVAIHNACDYIREGKGDLALAGAVNLYLHPANYIGASLAGLLSDTHKSPAFCGNGTGFVPGEGVGVVVLKSLARAIADRDGIYAVIRGTAVNHGGKTLSYTTPNPNQQAEVIRQALAQHNLDPRSITYIEAAANGSEMGDAIEMAAIQKVFGERSDSGDAYRIGSVKPNIGHCESASGMSQLSKVIFALKNCLLAPTLLVENTLNPAVDFSRLPFQLQRQASPWQQVQVDDEPAPRRAGINSVGAGGVNAHIIVEEYINTENPPEVPAQPRLFVLSAKSRERLQAYVQRWMDFLRKNPLFDLANTTYTLQTGREAMPYRLALIVESKEDLQRKLELWIEQGSGADEELTSSDIDANQIDHYCKTRNLQELAGLWLRGETIPWQDLYQEELMYKQTGLPTYPFKERKCWPFAIDPEPAFNKAVEFYSVAAQATADEFFEDYLTFAPFEKKIPGFSYTRLCLHKEQYTREWEMVRGKQKELRQVLFCKEDFERIQRVLDFGCGHGTDVIQIARLWPHIETHGYTITGPQAELGNKRIRELQLSDRATIFHRDSSAEPFPSRYDLIFGIEVSFHIRAKQALFRNITDSLQDNGRVLLMDYIANLRGPIVDPKVEISIPTVEDWIELLSTHGLAIDELVDVSAEIANFLYDPEHEENVAGLPEVVQHTLKNYANQSVSLEKGWISYCLFKLKKAANEDVVELRRCNSGRMSNKTPYREALAAMLDSGHIPYPPATPAEPPADAEREKGHSAAQSGGVYQRLLQIVGHTLGLQATDIEEAETLAELGIGSLNAVAVVEAINTTFDLRLPTSIIFESNTLAALAELIQKRLPDAAQPERSRRAAELYTLGAAATDEADFRGEQPISTHASHGANTGIAVIGLACRCAGAADQHQFWELISQGECAVKKIDNPAWLDFFERSGAQRDAFYYGAMADIEEFDARFFRISPAEAKQMEPAQRILLEACYAALEDAACSPAACAGKRVGTLIGCMGASPVAQDFSHFSMLGSETSILSARIAYFLDLKGPSLTINTSHWWL
ncbi:MAG: SDR family NAD(P)-dependent oxidoreductase [Exilibacterium sp.]